MPQMQTEKIMKALPSPRNAAIAPTTTHAHQFDKPESVIIDIDAEPADELAQAQITNRYRWNFGEANAWLEKTIVWFALGTFIGFITGILAGASIAPWFNQLTFF
jgi:hypothetical protein